MKPNSYFRLLATTLAFLVVQNTLSATEIIRYTGGGNFQAMLSVPPHSAGQRLPVIIYSYAEVLDWRGEALSAQDGYDLTVFLRTFNQWGCIGIIPRERYRKLNAVLGAIRYAETQLPEADPSQIYLIGFSDGALLSLIAANMMPGIRSIAVISPNSPHSKGQFSIPYALRHVAPNYPPVLVIIGNQESVEKLSASKIVYEYLTRHGVRTSVVPFPVIDRAFWSGEGPHMNTIRQFFFGRAKRIPNAKNPHPHQSA